MKNIEFKEIYGEGNSWDFRTLVMRAAIDDEDTTVTITKLPNGLFDMEFDGRDVKTFRNCPAEWVMTRLVVIGCGLAERTMP